MKHFLFQEKNLIKNQLVFRDDKFHYLVNVRRISQGDTIIGCSEKGVRYLFTVKEILFPVREIHFSLIELLSEENSEQRMISVFLPLIKGDYFYILLRMLCECGVSRIIPFISSHSVIKEFSSSRIKRCQGIIESVFQQSGRTTLPILETCINFKEMIRLSEEFDCVFWGNENGITQFTIEPNQNQFACITGPEGGFSDNEKKQFSELNHFIPVSLGTNILRADTAGITLFNRVKFFRVSGNGENTFC